MNIARLFVEKRQVAWVALVATLVWGVVSYLRLPQRKDPEVIIKTAVVTTVWPGSKAEDVEQLVTRPIELVARQVPRVDKVVSTTRTGISTVFITLEDTVRKGDLDSSWSDLRSRLDLLERALPVGVVAPQLNTSFGDTATVVFTVASPPADRTAIEVRAAAITRAIVQHRAGRGGDAGRATTVFSPAPSVATETVARAVERYRALGEEQGAFRDAAIFSGASFFAVDYEASDLTAVRRVEELLRERVIGAEVPHPDIGSPIVVRVPAEVRAALGAVSADKYTYRQLDEATTTLRDELARLPEVARVDRHGVVPERIHLLYSQERLASLGLSPRQIVDALRARNATSPAGTFGTGKQTLLLDSSGTIGSLDDVLGAVVGTTSDGRPVYARDVVEVHRTYETPISDASYLTWHGDDGWHRTRSIALAVQMRAGQQATAVGLRLDAAMAELRGRLPPDLVIVKSTDQPELVAGRIHEFMRSLGEAVAIVIGIALLFMERRSALLVAASIPITLAMTFGLMDLFRLDLQQVSIAALIISLGLLVDDPVIAGDAINREIAAGVPRARAAWQGPTRLAKAIFFATLTNVVAFAPLLLVTGTMGDFIYSLPMVVSLSLISSRVVSQTFMPLLGYYLLRGQKGYEAALEGTGRAAQLARKYNAVTEWMLDHKAVSFVGFGAFLVLGLAPVVLLRTQFFPEEAMKRFYVHVRLPEGSDVRSTEEIARRAQGVIVDSEPDRVERITSFVGNGGPRWWTNVSPEPRSPNYALMIVEARRADESAAMIARLQRNLASSVAGARFEVYRVSSGKPAITPVEVRISGPDIGTLRRLAEQVKDKLAAVPQTSDVADDWGADTLKIALSVDEARAAASGLSRVDIAASSMVALTGATVTTLREGDRLLDVSLRLRPSERASASSVRDLYIWSSRSGRAVPLEQVATLRPEFEPQKIVRYDGERTITVGALPKDGQLASVLLSGAKKEIAAIDLPPGYWTAYGGEEEMQAKAFASVSIALKVSVGLIFLVLVWQFSHFFKPFIVFAAIPFGLVGVVLGLSITRTHFGFMAFLGVASLIGVIVSHIIVLFDFIEEARERGQPLHRAVIDAGLVRLRPVLVTVLATVGGLLPLGLEGGPMWRQLVYVQIGGLLLATVVTKGVVPLLYVVFVETFHLVEWRADHVDDLPPG